MGRRPNVAKDGNACTGQTHMHNPHKDMPNPTLKGANPGQVPKAPPGLYLSKKKAPNIPQAIVRRSARIRNAVALGQDQGLEPVIEEIDGNDSEEEEEPQTQTERASSESDLFNRSLSRRSLEEKVDYIFELLAVQDKMIEALTTEAYQLGLKLEDAFGRLDACENGTSIFFEMIEKLKDVILGSNLSRDTETTFNVSSQAVVKAPEPVVEPECSASKRRKVASRK